MTTFPYRILSMMQHLDVLIGRARMLYPADADSELMGLVDKLQELSLRMISPDGSGEQWINQHREYLAGWEQTLMQTVPQPSGFTMSRGTELAMTWREVNAISRGTLTTDLGDNIWFREALARLFRIAWQLGLKANSDAGVEEVPLP